MNILFLTHCYPRYEGDSNGIFIHILAAALVEVGHKVHVLSPHAPGLPEEETRECVLVRRFKYATEEAETLAYSNAMAESVFSSPRGMFRFFNMLSFWEKSALSWHAEASFNGVHAHWWVPAGVVARRLARRTGLPWGVTLHGTDVHLANKNAVFRFLANQVIGDSRGAAVVSIFLRDIVSKWGFIDVPVAPMPIQLDFFSPLPHKTKKEDDLVIFVAARLVPQKRVADAVRAVHFALEKGANLRLKIAGDGPERETLELLVKEMRLEEKVEFLGEIPPDQMVAQYDRSDIVLMLSEREGMGLVVAEAMARGRAVIVAHHGGVEDFGKSGARMVPLGDFRAVAEEISHLASNVQLRNSMGRRSKEYASGRFRSQEAADKYVDCYRAWDFSESKVLKKGSD